MNEVDDAILEYFEHADSPAGERILLPPKAIYVNLVVEMGLIDRSTNTISRRMKNLDEMGLLERVSEELPYYRITDKGLAYLAGDIDSGDIPSPD